MSAALAAVDARHVTLKALASLDHELDSAARLRVVATGKAAVGMATAVMEKRGTSVVGGVITANVSADAFDERWRVFAPSHPVPTSDSEQAGRAALELAAQCSSPNDLLLVCLSGGASAMLAVPAEGLSIQDKMVVNQRLLRAGLDIGSMNVVRRHLSTIKGGQLAARAFRTITLAISDVCAPVDDDPIVIGSGPTVGDPTTFADALAVIERADLAADMPAAVMTHLRTGAAGKVEGPVPPGDERLQRSAYWIVASRHDAMRVAGQMARQLDYDVQVEPDALIGTARDGARGLIERIRGMSRPACRISSGETTVQVSGDGRGGRNQELAVGALGLLAEVDQASLASVGTDGVDGPTDAAGAIVDSTMWTTLGPRAKALCDAVLARNDTYPLLDQLGGLLKTGPTGTNVGDLQVLLTGPS